MTRGVTLEGAFLLGTFISVLLYGIYVSIFILAMSGMSQFQRKSYVAPVVIVLLFVLTTASIILQIVDIFVAFIDHSEDVKRYFLMRSRRTLAGAIDAILFFNLSLGDAFMIWRLYAIWNNNIHVLWLPVILAIAGAVCGAVCVGFELRMMTLRDPTFASPVYTWSLASICLSLCLTVIVTFLICFRLLRVSRTVAPISERGSFYNKFMAALIESGAIYAITILLWASLVGAKQTRAANTASYLLTVIPGIVPTLIITRLHSLHNSAPAEVTFPAVRSEPASSSVTVSRAIELNNLHPDHLVSVHQVNHLTIHDGDTEVELRSMKKATSFVDFV
ncbi:hypothetical protein FRC03_011683 [Tulasnella sp. 419]|nr:hypothetical protein FRC03_011683 [Tulasnella sp. 419]